MQAAVARIEQARRTKGRIVVFGDYDVDGITSTALLVLFLREIGCDVRSFLPMRLEEGYGLGLDAIRRCIATLSPSLIVTVDCGTNSVESVEVAREAGVDVVITDHHDPAPQIASAVAVVNPKRGTDADLHILAGVGVAFKLAHAIVKSLRASADAAGDVDLKQHLDLVALGTIADMVPLQGENRIFAASGLQAIRTTTKTGIRALCEVAAIEGDVAAHDVGFKIGPRLNASGRLGNAEKSLDLLLSDDMARCAQLARELDETNRERQDVEKQILEEAIALAELHFEEEGPHGLVLCGDDWHPGVVGIVATRIVQRYGYPAVCLAKVDDTHLRGSCRSVEGFDIAAQLQMCKEFLLKHGGHTMAAGLELRIDQLDAFRSAFRQRVAAFSDGQVLRPVLKVDDWLDASEISEELVHEIETLRPFGTGHTTPVWGLRNARVTDQRVLKEKHLKLRVESQGKTFSAIAFNRTAEGAKLDQVDLAFQLKLDTYAGKGVSLQIQDFRTSNPT